MVEENLKKKVEEEKVGAGKEEEKSEKKVEKKKPEIVVKEMAIANGVSLRISPKYSASICKVIRGKTPEAAIARLEDVISEKRPIPMANLEVGHKRGIGLSGGRFPKKACLEIINVIKQVGANSIVNGIENPIITIAKANQASAPFRRDGRKAKRTHIYLEVRDKSKLIRKKK
ncbi:MAG: hypothetical protein NUV97_02485 [archaeon]|nr:hypothetical protein [archaeon]